MSVETEFFERIAESVALRICDRVEERVRAVSSLAARTDLEPLGESDAADFLKVSKDTLQAWRKRGLMPYINYPKGRLKAGAEDGLSDMYAYRLEDLKSFADRFLVEVDGKRRLKAA